MVSCTKNVHRSVRLISECSGLEESSRWLLSIRQQAKFTAVTKAVKLVAVSIPVKTQAIGFHRTKRSLAARTAAKTDSYLVCFLYSWTEIKSNGCKPRSRSIKSVPALSLHRTALLSCCSFLGLGTTGEIHGFVLFDL